MTETRADGTVWKVPMIHWDRTRNSLNLSRDDFERMTKVAETNPSLRDALEHAKMLWLLSDDGRRPDSQCYPVLYKDAEGNRVK